MSSIQYVLNKKKNIYSIMDAIGNKNYECEVEFFNNVCENLLLSRKQNMSKKLKDTQVD